jgi:preprotein translocase subunit SecY
MCGENARQASTDRTVVNILRLLYFIGLIFLSFVLAFSDFPGRIARHSQGESGTILIISSRLVISVSKHFAKNATDVSREMSGEVLHKKSGAD